MNISKIKHTRLQVVEKRHVATVLADTKHGHPKTFLEFRHFSNVYIMFPITLLINAPNNLFWVTDSVVIKKTDLHIFLKKIIKSYSFILCRLNQVRNDKSTYLFLKCWSKFCSCPSINLNDILLYGFKGLR